MGCGNSRPVSSWTPEEEQSSKIDAELKMSMKASKQKERTIKVLLLGTGESGKSTVLKQMHLIYGKGFEDREAYITVVRANLVQSAQVVLEAMPFLDLPLPESLEPDSARVRGCNMEELDNFDPELRDGLIRLYANRNFKQAIVWGNTYQLNDSTVYLFDHIQEMCSPRYIPSDNDILRARVRSTGITEDTFKVTNLTWRVFDVGGQRSERRKWAHCFEDVHVLLYLVAVSEYDQRLFEDENVLRVSEALEVYKAMVNSRWFRNTTFILFMNKVDLFKEKLERHALEQYYPDYTGGSNVSAALEYMLAKFMAVTPANKPIYPHYTTATETNSLKVVMKVVQEKILQEAIARAGLV